MWRKDASMKKYLSILGKVAVLAIFTLAVWLLYHKLRSYSLGEIKRSLHQIPLSHLLLSFGLMIINYMVLVGYDWLALKAIHKKLPLARVSLVSFVGCVISYNFGALLGGSTVRYRLYSAWGFNTLDIVRLVLMLAVTFWVGAMGLAPYSSSSPWMCRPSLGSPPIISARLGEHCWDCVLPTLSSAGG